DLHPFAVLPVSPLLGYLSDVDLWIEIRRKRFPVASGVTVDDVEVVNLVEKVLRRVSRENIRHPRIKSAPKERHDAAFTVALVIRPLPFIFETSFVARLVIRRVDVMNPRFEARVHDR